MILRFSLDAVTDTASPIMPARLASLLLVPEPAEPSPPDKPSPASHMPNHYDLPSPARTCRNRSCPLRPTCLTAAVRDLSAPTSHAFPHRHLPIPSDQPCRVRPPARRCTPTSQSHPARNASTPTSRACLQYARRRGCDMPTRALPDTTSDRHPNPSLALLTPTCQPETCHHDFSPSAAPLVQDTAEAGEDSE